MTNNYNGLYYNYMNSPLPSNTPETSKGVSRRTVLLTIAGLATIIAADNHERILDTVLPSSSADQLVKAFPTSLPGAARVEKFRNRNAKKVFVHVRQIHETGHDTEKMREKMLQCQGDIEQILAALMEHPDVNLREIYYEGHGGGLGELQNMLAESDKTFADLDDDLLKIYEMEREFIVKQMQDSPKNRSSELLQALGLPPDKEPENLPQQLKDINEKISTLKKKSTGESKMNVYGPKKLAREKGLRILDAENVVLNLDAMAMYEEGNIEGFIKIQEQRDDAVLEIASGSQSLCVVTVYGAAHSWKRNIIDKWNKEHPEQQYSLIEITPATVANDGYDKKRRN